MTSEYQYQIEKITLTGRLLMADATNRSLDKNKMFMVLSQLNPQPGFPTSLECYPGEIINYPLGPPNSASDTMDITIIHESFQALDTHDPVLAASWTEQLGTTFFYNLICYLKRVEY